MSGPVSPTQNPVVSLTHDMNQLDSLVRCIATMSLGSELTLTQCVSAWVCFPQRGSAKCVFRLSGHITAVKTLSFCPSGLALVSGGIGGLLNIWSLQVRPP